VKYYEFLLWITIKLKIKSCLFPLQPTHQNCRDPRNFIDQFEKKYIFFNSRNYQVKIFWATFFTAFWKYQHQWMYLIIFNVIKHLKTFQMIIFVWYFNCWWKKIKYFPTYLPIGHIAESERGNKEYFNLGLM
jgi:hypothetical protein